MKRIVSAMVAVLVVIALGACSRMKAPAELAIKAAEEALSAAKTEAMKYVPDQFKSAEDALKSAKDSFAKGEYEKAASAAKDVAAKAKELVSAAVAKKNELTKGWEEQSAGLPNMIGDIKSRIAALSKSKKLPKGLDKTKLEGAKSGLEEVSKAWDDGNKAFKEGSLADAFAKAKSAKEKAAEIMSTLGMKVSRAAKG
jgi:predicted small lipoprotein YifL